jgi:Carboxypeptidase regulatory-like domain
MLLYCQVMRDVSKCRRERFSSWLPVAVFLLWLMVPTWLRSETISGTVQDPSGAVIAEARIEISGKELAQAVVFSSDGLGKFASPELKPGTYSVRVDREGFEPLVKTVDLQGSLQLRLTLAIAKQQVSVTVTGKGLAFANSDAIYRQLRGIGLGQGFRFDNFTLVWDAATFQFQKGVLIFLNPVNGVATGAIFVGEGHFNLKPATALDARGLNRRTGASDVNEDFTEAVFRFTGEARLRFFAGLGAQTDIPPEALAVFNHWKERMRQRNDPALSFTQYLLQGETMDNVDADLLASVYNDAHPAFFNAYLRGKKHKDLRFFVRMRVGALPQLDSPEEVALVDLDPEGMDDGVWYLAHLKSEYANHTADSRQERRLFATRRYKIETVIAKNGHLFSTATISFESLVAGERVLKFGLLPNLRVTRVTDELGRDLYFVQEGRKEDGSFYVILPQAPPLGKEQSINVEYAGDKVLEEAGEGSFYVGARTSWYPNLNGFGERAFYDLTFKVPQKYKVISVGRLQGESVDHDLAVSHWVTPIPVAVAGFNYGEYKKLDLPDEITGYKISGFYLSELPDNLRGYPALQSVAPGRMTKYALEQTRAQLQLCSFYFGKIPYEEIYITEQPDFNFG